jgi:hypothetical protein
MPSQVVVAAASSQAASQLPGSRAHCETDNNDANLARRSKGKLFGKSRKQRARTSRVRPAQSDAVFWKSETNEWMVGRERGMEKDGVDVLHGSNDDRLQSIWA